MGINRKKRSASPPFFTGMAGSVACDDREEKWLIKKSWNVRAATDMYRGNV